MGIPQVIARTTVNTFVRGRILSLAGFAPRDFFLSELERYNFLLKLKSSG